MCWHIELRPISLSIKLVTSIDAKCFTYFQIIVSKAIYVNTVLNGKKRFLFVVVVVFSGGEGFSPLTKIVLTLLSPS